jgi:hypothetical protein
MVLMPPTYITLLELRGLPSVEQALSWARDRGMRRYAPRLVELTDGRCAVHTDDVAYDDGDLNKPGSRHRLWMLESGWRYELSPAP